MNVNNNNYLQESLIGGPPRDDERRGEQNVPDESANPDDRGVPDESASPDDRGMSDESASPDDRGVPVAPSNRLALYREWRPRTFKDVVEQEHVVTTLKNSIANNRIAHAYLFCGVRGTGKTTLAQVLSRAVNCLNPRDSEPCNECEICRGILAGRILDVAEIDAASNNSVDNVRVLRDQINYAPAQTKYKVYIIDEVHMLSGNAFNALLKTLEEPPSYVIFILATTDAQKLPATILSRCQRFDFKRISDEAITGRLSLIAEKTGLPAEQDALRLIAKLSEGSLRDAISIFDQCVSARRDVSLTLADVLGVTGRPEDESFMSCAKIILDRNVKAIPEYVAGITASGVNLPQYTDGMTVFFRNMLMIKLGQGRGEFPEMSGDTYGEINNLAERCDIDRLLSLASEFSLMSGILKNSVNQTVLLEVTLTKLCLGRYRSNEAIDNINARIRELEIWRDAAAVPSASRETMPDTTRRAPVTTDTFVGADISQGIINEPISGDPNETEPYMDGEQGDGVSEPPAGGEQGDVVSELPAGGNPDDNDMERAASGDLADTEPHENGRVDTILNENGVGVPGPVDGVNILTSMTDLPSQIIHERKPSSIQGSDEGDSPSSAFESADDTGAPIPADSTTAPISVDGANAPIPVDGAVWNKIITKFIVKGNPKLYSILQGTSAQIISDSFQIILPPDKASLSGILINPDGIIKIRDEICAETGKQYNIQFISEQDPLNSLAKKLSERFNIPTNIYP